jgi:hypothetical protein
MRWLLHPATKDERGAWPLDLAISLPEAPTFRSASEALESSREKAQDLTSETPARRVTTCYSC